MQVPPWKGADAIAATAEIIRFIRLAIQNAPTHPDLGMSTVTFGQITGGYRPYVVPDSAKLWIDMRLVPPLDTAVIAGILRNPNCMSYGPGNLECAHQPDEWVEITDILRCEQVYRQLTGLLYDTMPL